MNHVPFSSFERSAAPLRKKYRHFDEDFQECLDELLKNPPLYSVPLPAYARKVWKARLKNTDQQKGKSGGYRFIFYFDEQKPDTLYGLDIYPKSVQEDIPASELAELYKRFVLFIAERFRQQQQQQKPPQIEEKKPDDPQKIEGDQTQ